MPTAESVFDKVRRLEIEEEKEVTGKKRRPDRKHKVRAAQAQANIYNHLVQCRILLQRGQSQGVSVKQCNDLLVQLLCARKLLVTGKVDDNYSEALADQEKLDECIREEYQDEVKEWKKVLNRCHQSVQLHQRKGSSSNNSFSGSKSSLLNSTLWEQVEINTQHEMLQQPTSFDDSKIYQHLLKEFLSSSSSSGVAGGETTVTRNRKRSKRPDIDRRASKGRVIRYTPFPKLENFCFPQSRPSQGTLDDDEWFASLWGGALAGKEGSGSVAETTVQP